MEIISLDFAFFVLISLLIFYLLPGKLQNLFLLLASYYFYSTWSLSYVVILLGITVFNFFYAQWLQNSVGSRRKIVLWVGVGLNLVVLFLYLFGNLPSANLANLVEQYGASFEAKFILPIGLSYYILECISNLFDIRLKIAKPSKNFIDFALYLVYFPKLISGPIERARKFLPQLSAKKVIDNEIFARSTMLIVVGLTQTVILGGALTVLYPANVMDTPQDYTSPELIMGLLVFMFYLYNQFAGYTKIVRGISGLFGIELSRNFAYPFFSKDFSDFWNRWHISLSQWLRDYIYLPLSRAFLRRNPSRSNKANLILPPLATMLASGMWHGASWNLLLWGALNGFYVIMENLLNLYRPASPKAQKPIWRQILSSIVVIGLATLAVIPFRLDLATSKVFLYRLAFAWEWQLPDLRPLIILALSLILDWLQYRHNDEFIFLKWPHWRQALIGALAALAIIIVYNLQNAPATFIYP